MPNKNTTTKDKGAHAFDSLVIGCGFAGAVVARELAERADKRVLLLEKNPHIGGNAYDCIDESGILVHRYGPHIFHTNDQRVFSYLARFTSWRKYDHEVLADLHGQLVPVPFNLNTLQLVYDAQKAERCKEKLLSVYGLNHKVTLHELQSQQDSDLSEIASFVYENIFRYYTQKQWGLSPEEIDPSVLTRVPIVISYDNRYFQDAYQGIPKDGYTALFTQMLDHPNITTCLSQNTDLRLQLANDQIFLDGVPFQGEVIYTGALDELFGCCYGRLPYRTLDFVFETHPVPWYQRKGTINYTVSQDYTRISEFKHLTGQRSSDATTIVKEYPKAYTGEHGQTPYYPMENPQSRALYERYSALAQRYPNLYPLGRLAQFTYYNMDTITQKALQLADRLAPQTKEEIVAT